MFSIKSTMAAAAALTVFAAVPANATITTFADYSAIGTASNVYWKNNGSTASNGTGGSFYTISSGNSVVPGTTTTKFSFLQSALAPYVTGVTANFTMLASVTNSPALTTGGFKIEQSILGSFSFTSTSVITIGSDVFGVGSNLLSGTFTQGAIFGQTNGTSGSLSSATTSGATITYTSDFLNFLPTVERDFALSLTSIAAPLTSSNGRALRSFGGVSTGSFSTDPAPIPISSDVPEPASWAMMVGGFGIVGATLRRKKIAIRFA